MNLRGPILIATSLSLVVSSGALHYIRQQAEANPANIETVAAKRASCETRGIDTPFGRLGCDAEAQGQTTWQRRTGPGGALFISNRTK